VLLNDEMDDFSAAPGQPNAYGLVGGEANRIEAGKTPLSSMTPTLILNDEGELRMAIGSPGGSTIITTVLQIVLHVIDRKMGLADAIAQPRLHHQWLPDCVFVDPGQHRPKTLSALRSKGHCVEARRSIGNVHGVLLGSDGLFEAAADPRGEGEAAALTRPPAKP
jgi:gamma-glutamyltranspeptidase/glutathione hydrolase